MELIEKQFSWRDEIARVKASMGTPVAYRYWVEEYVEAYNTGGYYDQDIPERIVDRSKYFDTADEAEAFKNTMRPSKTGNKLRVQKQTLWEKHIPAKVERRWL